MALNWFALLKAVPWGEVARNAPVIAENAKKLWSTVSRKPPKQELDVHTVFTSEDQEISWLKERLITIEAANTELHNQMLTTSELVKALADQNTQLINRIELNRLRIFRLAAITIAIGIIAVYCFATIIFA
ncbi:MAG: hypothetical protein ACXW1T_04540 [Methylophilus sp.]